MYSTPIGCDPHAVAQELAENGGLPAPRRIAKQWRQTGTFEFARDARQSAESGIEIHEFNQPVTNLPARTPRRANDQRHAGAPFVVRHLAPAVVVAQFPTLITPQYHNCIVCELQAIQLVEQLGDLRVDVTDRGEVTMP